MTGLHSLPTEGVNLSA